MTLRIGARLGPFLRHAGAPIPPQRKMSCYTLPFFDGPPGLYWSWRTTSWSLPLVSLALSGPPPVFPVAPASSSVLTKDACKFVLDLQASLIFTSKLPTRGSQPQEITKTIARLKFAAHRSCRLKNTDCSDCSNGCSL